MISERRGKFVILRPIQETDADITLKWRLGDRANLLNRGAETVEEQRRWIASRPDSEVNFIIELVDHRPVGMVSLLDISQLHKRAEPARFLIGEEDAVKGIPAAVEAMKLIYELAFDELGLVRLYGFVAQENPLIYKWQKYLGMKEEGRFRNHYYLNGHFQDAICMGLLEEDYRKVSLPRMNVLINAGSSHLSNYVKNQEYKNVGQ